MPPPFLRIAVLISATVLLLGLAFVTSDARTIRAQTTATVDYDTDNDGLIEIRTREQWGAMHYDLDGDGTPESRNAQFSGTDTPWATGFPNAMTAAGCPARDHDNDPMTADQASCIGYELLNDLTINSGNIGAFGEHDYQAHAFTAKFVGNGYRVHGLNLTQHSGEHNSLGAFAELDYSASVEGLGLISPDIQSGYSGAKGTITSRLRGKIIGSYTEGGWVRSANSGGLVGTVYTHASNGAGLIAHSYVRGTRVGDRSQNHGGLAATFEQNRGSNSATCLNSYFSGDVDGSNRGLLTWSSQGTFINCVGDSTTDANDGGTSTSTTTGGSNGSGTTAATNANMKAVTDYDTPATNNPFSGWDDYPLDGTTTQLGATEPRTDAWHFGDETNLPVLNAWGHDFTLPLDRSVTGASTVNICTRTLAVANEIIKHLKDNVRRTGVTTTPAAVTNLGTCTASTDTQNVSITNLTDLVVTTPTHTFNLNPDRTNPPADRITSLHFDDFAYLTNVAHIDLGNNDLETLPTRLFQALPLRYLDLSNNKLTTLPADLFAGVATVSTVGGNSLLLNGNTLTDTGIPGRIFDTMPHLNGLDLSDNALTRVNTRWFQALANLGRKAATTPPYTHALGLHLAGNTLTEHYYASKLFTGVRDDVTPYADVTTPTAATAGDALRTAITAAITARAGGTTPTTLSLTGTDYYNTGASAAYTATACPATGTAGPGRFDYLGDAEPACYIQPHWTPPHKSSDTATAAPSFTGTTVSGTQITTQFSHTQTAEFVAYQTRYRAAGDRWSTWQVVPIQYSTGTRSGTVPAVRRGETYTIEMRALSTTGPPSAAVSRTANIQAADWITGFSVASGTTFGAVALSWNAISSSALPSNHAVTAFYYRYKLQSESIYESGWRSVPDGSDSGDSVTDETAHVLTGVTPDAYDVQLAAGIDGPDADSEPDFLTDTYTATATAYGVPAGLAGVPLQWPGFMRITWNAQTISTSSDARFQIRSRLAGVGTWTNWINVVDSNDAGTHRYDETGWTITFLTPYRLYDAEVRFHDGTTPGPVVRINEVRAGYQPQGLTATTGVAPGTIDVNWAPNTLLSHSTLQFRVRAKLSSATDWTGATSWFTTTQGDRNATGRQITGLQAGTLYDVQGDFRGPGGTWQNASYLPTVTSIRSGIVQPPTGFAAATATAAAGAVALTWDPQTASTSADSKYQYRYKLESAPDWTGATWTDVDDGSDADTNAYNERSVNATGLTTGMSYDFQLRFHWNSTYGESTTVSAGPANASGIPAPPNFAATPGTNAGSVDLSWDLIEGATEYQYRYRQTNPPSSTWGSWTQVTDQDSDSDITDEDEITISSGLTAGTSYTFELRARVSTSNGPSSSDEARAQTQLPPTNVAFATSATAGGISVSWGAPTGGTPTGYEYRYKLNSAAAYPTSGMGSWTDVPDVDNDGDRADERSYTITSLWADVRYDLQLRAQSANGASFVTSDTTGTNIRSGTLTGPVTVTATTGDAPGEIDLTWSWSQINTNLIPTGDTVVHWQYRTRLGTAIAWADWVDIPGAATRSHTITGLSSYTGYDVEIRAAMDDGDDADTDTANYYSAVGAPASAVNSGLAIPADLRATAGTNPGELDLTWTAQTVFGATSYPNAAYQVRSKLATASWPTTGDLGWSDISGSSVTTASLAMSDLKAGLLHDIQVRFLPSSSLTSGPASIQATPTVVPTPTSFTAATATLASGAIDLTWMAQSASTSSEAKYQYRSKLTSAADWTGATWNDVDDGSDALGHAYDEAAAQITGLTAGASYDIELRFHWDDTIGPSSAATATATASSVPMPTGFTASAGTAPGTIDLSWTAVASAGFEFRTKVTTAADSTYTAWTSAGSGTSHTVTGLTNGENYTVQLRVTITGTGSGPAATATATAQQQPGPQNYATAQGTNAGEIGMSWDAPASGTVVRYEFRYKLATDTAYPADGTTGGWNGVPDGADTGTLVSDETSHTVTSLRGGLSYNVQLRVQASAGYSIATTSTRTATPVAAPTNFTAARGAGPGAVDLSWTVIATTAMPTNDSVVQYQYRTKLSSASASAYSAWTNIAGATTTSYTVTGLAAYTLHDIQLRAAIDDGGDADTLADYHSSAATQSGIRTGLAVPADLRATPGTNPGQVNLNWTAQTTFTSGSFPNAEYEFRTKLTSASWPTTGDLGWTDITGSSVSTGSHTISNLLNGQLHDVELRFLATSMLFSAGASVQATPRALAVPTGLTAATAANTSGAIDITWDAQSAITVSTAEFQYRAKTTSASWPGTTPFGWTPIPDGSDSDSDAHNEDKYTITGLTADAQYDVQLRLFMSSDVGASAPASATATASRVPVPTGFNATTGSGAGEIDLTWTAVMGATGYQFRCVPSASGCTNAWSNAGTGTSHTIPNLTGGAFYNVQLRARVTGIGESAPTSSQRAQAQTTPGPATLTFSQGPNPGDIKLDWTAPAMNAPVMHYEYRYKLETAADSAYPAAYTQVPDSDGDSDLSDETTVTITGLQAGVSYHIQFRVFASQAIQYSLPQRGTQASKPVPPPTSFAAAMGTNPGEVNLSWTAPSGVTILRYELRHRRGTTGDWSSWTSAGTSTSYTYTGLLAGASRTFQLRAVMQTVGSSAPVSVNGTPRPVPTPVGFDATTGTYPGEIDLTWGAVTGATNYEYRYRLTTEDWPTESTWRMTTATSTTLSVLNEGETYAIEVRAAITNVGKSPAAADQAVARGAMFTDAPSAPAIPTGDRGYSISASAVPGRIAIQLPTQPDGSPIQDPDPFIYRYATSNPGHWSRWYKVEPTSGDTQFLIPDLTPGVLYDIEVRAYTGTATGFTTALEAEAQAAPLEKPADFEVSETSGVILLKWASPELYTPDNYEYRTRPSGTAEWGDWVAVQHEGLRGSTQRHYITGLESGISHDFELRMQTGAGPSPSATSAGTARLRLAEAHTIKPVVREVSIRAGETIALTVNIYDTQEVLDNTIPDMPNSKLVFRWTEQDSRGRAIASGGTFGTPNDERRIDYTAPNTPGVYIIQAEAQPDGVCTSHHEGEAEISTSEREQCQAIFTIRVTAAPTVAPPRPDPVNPTGSIPTSLTDNQGTSYAVVTPADGGTFTGQDITVTAPEGAVPDRTILGITARVSDITPPTPIPGATISVAGRYYEINALQESGDPPLQSYTLAAPVTACLPFPDEFRATLSNVVLIQRTQDGNLSPLSTKIRTNNGTLSVCGTISTLPATVAVARLGLVPAATAPTPAPEQPLPDTGGTAPSPAILLLTLLAGAILLAAISRIRRIKRPL